jgi:hypothetical protein
MTHSLGALDRLRIERLVWGLDQQLYDLPRRSRIEHRREVRANLLTAASDVGTSEALRRVGTSRALAAQFLTAELGEGPRHSWVAAAYFAALVPLALMSLLSEVSNAYARAIVTVAPHATGSYTYHGVSYLQTPVHFDFTNGVASQTGGAFTPLVYVLWAAGTVAVGRLWRLIPLRRGA